MNIEVNELMLYYLVYLVTQLISGLNLHRSHYFGLRWWAS